MSSPLRRSVALPLVLCAGILVVPGCGPRSTGAEELAAASGARPREAPKVRTAPAVRREMVRYLETTTVLESEYDIDLFARRPGEVADVLAEEGDRVGAGDVLARLADREERLAVEEAEIALEEARQAADRAELGIAEARGQLESAQRAAEQAERNYRRDARLHESRDVASPLSEKALETSRLARDDAAAEREQAEIALRRAELEEQSARTLVRKSAAALERARLALDEMRIVAPFPAVVAQRNVRLGDSVGSGEFAFKLTDPLELRAVFHRPQRELSMFQGAGGSLLNGGSPGLAVTAVAEAIPGRVFEGEIVRVSPTIDRTSGNFRVTAVLGGAADGEEGPDLLPGMLLRLKIATERHRDALVVPKRAVRREGDRSFLFAVEDGRLDEVEVTEGFTDDEHVEVTAEEPGALEAGDAIVVVGARDLEGGDAVQVENELLADTRGADDEEEKEKEDGVVAEGGDAAQDGASDGPDSGAAERGTDSGTSGSEAANAEPADDSATASGGAH